MFQNQVPLPAKAVGVIAKECPGLVFLHLEGNFKGIPCIHGD